MQKTISFKKKIIVSAIASALAGVSVSALAQDDAVEEIVVRHHTHRAVGHVDPKTSVHPNDVVVDLDIRGRAAHQDSITHGQVERVVAHGLTVVSTSDRDAHIGVGIDHIVLNLAVTCVGNAGGVAVDPVAAGRRVGERNPVGGVGVHLIAAGQRAAAQ